MPTTTALSLSSQLAINTSTTVIKPSSTLNKTITDSITMIKPTSVYTRVNTSYMTQEISTRETQLIRPTNTTILSLLSTVNISLTTLTVPLVTVSTVQPSIPITNNPTEEQTKLLLPLFYIIVLACVGATLLLGIITLLLSIICFRGKKKKRRIRRRHDSERVSLCNLNRTNSSGSSHSSASAQPMNIVNTTNVVLRQNPGRNYTDSFNSRSSKWFNRGSMRPLSAHNPSLNCTTFKPNQQLYLPHIQVQVHVNNEFPTSITPESRVGSYCQLEEEEKKPISLGMARRLSTDSANSIVDTMLTTR